jgi:phenylacetic acid degradation operon negative regulatory protein
MRHAGSVSRRGHAGGPDPAVARWIARTLAADPPRARSLVVTVWGDALAPHGGEIWLAALLRLLAPFGLNERLVRTSVFRLSRDGWIEAESRGRQSRYRLTPGGRARFEAAYRRIYSPPPGEWSGEWDVVLLPAASDGGARARLRDELRWAGYGALLPGCFMRPAQAAQPDATGAFTPSAATTQPIVLRAKSGEASGADGVAPHAGKLWDLPAIAATYRRFLALFGGVIERFRSRDIAHADPAQCFVVRTLLIHAFRRVLLRDPRLPPALLPLDWPGAAAYTLTRDFYRLALARAEAHLASVVAVNGSRLPPADASFYDRFGGLAPDVPPGSHR